MNSRMLRSEKDRTDHPVFDYWRLFRDLPEAYMVLDATTPELRIVEVNKAREKLMGVSRKNSVGRPMFQVFPDMGPEFKETGISQGRKRLEEVIRTRKPKRFEASRYDTRDDSGEVLTRYWQTTYVPLFDSAGRLTHIVSSGVSAGYW